MIGHARVKRLDRRGSVSLRRLRTHKTPNLVNGSLLIWATKHGRLSVLRFLQAWRWVLIHKPYGRYYYVRNHCQCALIQGAKHGHASAIKFLIRWIKHTWRPRKPRMRSNGWCCTGCFTLSLKVPVRDMATKAAKHGHVRVLQTLRRLGMRWDDLQYDHAPWWNVPLQEAALHGQVGVLQYLKQWATEASEDIWMEVCHNELHRMSRDQPAVRHLLRQWRKEIPPLRFVPVPWSPYLAYVGK